MGTAALTSFELDLLEGPQAGVTLKGNGASLCVGRARAASVQLQDPAVSERHAELKWTGCRWELRDLGSTNGTTLNGTPLQKQGAAVPVNHGDVIMFGTVSKARFQVVLEGANEGSTLGEFLEMECLQLQDCLRKRTEQLASQLRGEWRLQKENILGA